jgi:uncharacterized membrane protein YgcG
MDIISGQRRAGASRILGVTVATVGLLALAVAPTFAHTTLSLRSASTTSAHRLEVLVANQDGVDATEQAELDNEIEGLETEADQTGDQGDVQSGPQDQAGQNDPTDQVDQPGDSQNDQVDQPGDDQTGEQDQAGQDDQGDQVDQQGDDQDQSDATTSAAKSTSTSSHHSSTHHSSGHHSSTHHSSGSNGGDSGGHNGGGDSGGDEDSGGGSGGNG